ncbi:MAG: hypothetical protein K2P81_02375 [Bacteriovoracaceae bacterium]|nr:hypothetical protein [Bacteriovoracaceae bacterium]
MFRSLSNFLIFCFILSGAQSCASPLSPASQASTIATYHKLYDQHRKTLCPSGVEDEYNRLLKRYRGFGHWVPELAGDVDYVTVSKLIPEMEKKLAWIQSQRSSLIKRKKLPTSVTLKPIENLLKELLTQKYEWETQEGDAQKKAGERSLANLKKLKVEWKKMMGKIPFLTTYASPVDHLKNRKIHDEFRDREDNTSRQVANYAFFYRRILEDGAYNPDHTGSDSWLRTTLDTVELEIERPMIVIHEDLRYDLDFILARIQKELDRGKDSLVARLGEWEERTSGALQFYRDLVDPDNREKSRALIKERNQASLQLKEWVASQQAKSWLWWHSQDESMRAIYVIETILYNEVGDVDSNEALERLDVAQVVMNRHGVPFYHTLDKEQDIYPLLKQEMTDKEIQSAAWLNILYRRGEFSFTYYYMPGSVKAFCPDMSPIGKRLQRENIEIALSVLRSPVSEFKALRYFSRASMPGRINMASVWENYRALPERPGLLASGQNSLREKMQQKKLTYLYKFEDPKGESFQVYQDENKIYVARLFEGKWVFYSWRNPHYFTYFGLKNPNGPVN